MQTNQSDEINMAVLLKLLLKYKVWIFAVTILCALAAFLISEFILPKEYQATTSVLLIPTSYNANLDSRITIPLNQTLDPKMMVSLGMSDEMIHAVMDSVNTSSTQPDIAFDKIKGEVSITLSGTNQLQLQVRDTNPERAALIANTWAKALATRINTLYGISFGSSAAVFNQRVEKSRQDWDDAEKNLVNYMQQSNFYGADAQFTQMQVAYNANLYKIHNIDLILSDARALDARLGAQKADAASLPEDVLGLITLQQRAGDFLLCSQAALTGPTPSPVMNVASYCVDSSGLSGLQIQFPSANLNGQSTVADVRQSLKRFADVLQTQQTELKNGLTAMEKQLSTLSASSEAEKHQLEKLTQQRDLAKSAYELMSSEATNASIAQASNNLLAKIAATAVAPALPVSPRIWLNTLVGALAGLIITIALAFLLEWRAINLQPAGTSGPKSSL